MTRIYNADQSKLVEKAAEELKKIDILKMPDWASFVKTGVAKERPPLEQDWWYKRAASILRKVYINNLIGVNRLRVKYSSRKNNGHKPEHTYNSGGKIIRTILQQLEKAELVKKAEIKNKKGRTLTPKGKSFLDKISQNAK
ncbi:30S ribosomal protein S19e [Candidatus Woesearchaeota archaeon]|nr:30S ribosomal protein S19e [Candidatus Woesearchaeota archaeon]